MQRARIIFNPLAGSRRMSTALSQVMANWEEAGWDIDLVETQRAGDGERLAREAVQADVGLIFGAGGDGTLGEVVNGLVGTTAVFAPLPLGTANAFAKSLGLPLPNRWHPERLLAASTALFQGSIHQIDVGFVSHGAENGRYWLLWAGVGADGSMVHKVEPRPRWSKKLGKLGYMAQGIKHLPLLAPFEATIKIDGKHIERQAMQILVSKARLYAGADMQLTDDSQLDDGWLDIWLLKTETVAGFLQLSGKVLLQQEATDRRVERFRGQKIEIHTLTPIACQTDGDPAGTTPVHVKICPQAVRLLTPLTAPKDLFSTPSSPLT